MVEFNGYLSGATERYFRRKTRESGQTIILLTFLFFLPIVILIAALSRSWLIILLFVIVIMWVMLLSFLPQSKRVQREQTPKRIYTEDEYIVYMTDKEEGYRLIDDAKQLIDHGDFYEIVYPFGKKTDKFICQKNLLICGSLEEFEELFEGKLVKQG